jgi:Holliday junction resolvasome RuvABC endonuclease subunit
MIYICGIDPSSKSIAIVATMPAVRSVYCEKFDLRVGTTGPYSPQVAAVALDVMDRFIATVPAIPHMSRVCYLESPVIGRGGARATMVQSFVSGVIQAALASSGFTVYLVNVQVWKKVVCGNGSADKTNVARTLRQKWPKAAVAAGSDQDLFDAGAICHYGVEREAASRNLVSDSQ